MTRSLGIPQLETERLILRGPEAADFEAYCTFLMDPIRAAGFGGAKTRSDAWRWFACNLGHWALNGYGYFTSVWKETGEPCGLTGLWCPEGWPEPELGWVVFAHFEGRGIAYEGALRARQWAYEDLGFETLTSNIVPGNTRSVALAERLGAKFEYEYDNVHMGRERLFRHPPPAELGLTADADGSPEAYA